MKSDTETKHIKKSIEERIKNEKLIMRPRSFFLFRAIGAYIVLGILFFVSLFLISFLQHVLINTEELLLVPWYLLIVLVLIVGLALKVLDRSIERVHRTPRLITFAGMLFLVILLATIIVRVSFVREILF